MGKYILYIDSMQRGGAQRVMTILAEHLSKTGEVILVNDILPVPDIPEYTIGGGVRRLFLDEGAQGSGGRNLRRIRRLRQIIRQEQPDAVVSFLGPPNLRMLCAAAGCRTRKIVSVRNDPYREYGAGVKKTAARLAFHLADAAVFQTEEATGYFGKSIRKKAALIPNPISRSFYEADWTGTGRNIIAVGRVQPQKNYPLLLAAFSRIARDHPDVDVDICGDGYLRDSLTRLADELGIGQRVHFHGIVSDIPRRLASSGVFVMTSDYEGMPNALMEAMAVGVPVIATDCPCGGPRALTENGTYGVLVPRGDPEALAQALHEMLAGTERAEYYHQKAKERAEAYRTEKVMQAWDRILSASSDRRKR